MLLVCVKGWVLGLALVGLMELNYLRDQVEKSAQVVVGNSEAQVLEAIGEPRHRWNKWEHWFWNDRPRRWVYGTRVDVHSIVLPNLPYPNPIAFKFRIFGAFESDLVVAFDDDRRVVSIQRPELTQTALNK